MNHSNEDINNINDIDKLKELLIECQENSKKHLELLEKVVSTAKLNNKGEILDVSTAYESLTGYSKKEILGSKVDMPTGIEKIIGDATNEILEGELEQINKDGKTSWVKSVLVPMHDDAGNKIGNMNVLFDISDKKKFELMAIKDSLTNLYNRRHFDDILNREIQRAKRDKKILAFTILDVDNFKKYNDCYGHMQGDKVLIAVGKLLNDSIHRSSDYAFRLGGEEFGIIFSEDKMEQALPFVESIRANLEALNLEHSLNDNVKVITASFGLLVVDFKEDDVDRNGFYSMADHALYKAKDSGRNKVVLHANEEDDLDFF